MHFPLSICFRDGDDDHDRAELLPLEDRGVLSSGRQGLNGMLNAVGGSSEDLPVEAMRDHLNGLVEESVAKKSQQVRLDVQNTGIVYSTWNVFFYQVFRYTE